ncbi:hypothetical protein TH25_21275 [Thalassospira profundimaris]|uniref:Transcriptional activator TraM n=1 Tax=Thalassospira profundimaris TaxID=502049 RepID=A0A367WT20_9PROT|nr:hypothetical protein [Thalassospira profundimaris]RCK43681.1 hypothetical protein TH25_21275 [Thalassospira profundimaris]
MPGPLDDAPPPPVTMDSIEELRTYLWQQHQITVDQDDPILLVHTILRLSLDEQRRLNDQYNRALSQTLRDASQDFTKDVLTAIDAFKAEALGDVVRERIKTMNETAEMAEDAISQFARLLRTQKILTTLNILAVVFVVGVLSALTL